MLVFVFFLPALAENSTNYCPTLAWVWQTNRVSVSGLCHVLLLYGHSKTDLSGLPNGDTAIKALTDESSARATFGTVPFIRTRNGVRYFLVNDPLFGTSVGESHRDQCLSTFATINLPLSTPIHVNRETLAVRDLLNESIATFTLDQKELAWTAMAFATYVPPAKEWKNRFSETTSFDQLVDRLITKDLNSESCAGTHMFQAILRIARSDANYHLLNKTSRQHLEQYIDSRINDIIETQNNDGSWGAHWSALNTVDNTSDETLQVKVLITGHLLETMALLPTEKQQTCVSALRKAALWLARALTETNVVREASWICPLTHAARVQTLWPELRNCTKQTNELPLRIGRTGREQTGNAGK